MLWLMHGIKSFVELGTALALVSGETSKTYETQYRPRKETRARCCGLLCRDVCV